MIIITILDDSKPKGSYFVGKTEKYTIAQLTEIMDDLGI